MFFLSVNVPAFIFLKCKTKFLTLPLKVSLNSVHIVLWSICTAFEYKGIPQGVI